jgi:hypothetical protein
VIPGRKLRVQWKDPNDGGASWTDRFVGHVESWPTTQGPTTAAYTSINVVDRLAALGLADELRSVPAQEILAGSNLAAYYPLNGDLGSVAEAPQESLMVRPGPEGTLDLQGGTGVPTDGGASPLFTPTLGHNRVSAGCPTVLGYPPPRLPRGVACAARCAGRVRLTSGSRSR